MQNRVFTRFCKVSQPAKSFALYILQQEYQELCTLPSAVDLIRARVTDHTRLVLYLKAIIHSFDTNDVSSCVLYLLDEKRISRVDDPFRNDIRYR